MACVKNERKLIFKFIQNGKRFQVPTHMKKKKKSGGLVYSNLKNFERD